MHAGVCACRCVCICMQMCMHVEARDEGQASSALHSALPYFLNLISFISIAYVYMVYV